MPEREPAAVARIRACLAELRLSEEELADLVKKPPPPAPEGPPEDGLASRPSADITDILAPPRRSSFSGVTGGTGRPPWRDKEDDTGEDPVTGPTDRWWDWLEARWQRPPRSSR